MAIIHNVRGGTAGLNEEDRLMIARLLVKAGYAALTDMGNQALQDVSKHVPHDQGGRLRTGR